MDSKEVNGHTNKALVTSRHQIKSPCPNCGTVADLSTNSVPRAISGSYPIRKMTLTWILGNPRDSVLTMGGTSLDRANNLSDSSEIQ